MNFNFNFKDVLEKMKDRFANSNNFEEDEFGSAANGEVEKPNSNPKHIIFFGLSVIFIVFILFFGWMSFAPLATSVVATGQISADVNKKTVQHLQGGIIKDILVHNGDFVEKDDTLILLDTTQIESSLKTLTNQYLEALATKARLEAQEKRDLKIDFPDEILEKRDTPAVMEIINGQQEVLRSKVNSLKEELFITKRRVEQFNNQIDGLNSLLVSNQARLDSIEEDINEQEDLFKDQLVDITRLRELRREKLRLVGEINKAKSDIKKLLSQIQETHSQQKLREKEFNNEVVTSLVETRTQVVDLKSKIESTKDTLDRTEIKAPASGYVTGLEIHTIGGVISPSKPIMHIVPKDSELFILGRVNAPDIDKLHEGLLADIRFSAFDVQQTYVVEGELINISADTFTDEQSGGSYYEVKLKVTESGKKQLQENKFFLLPGMPAEVMINVGDRTVLSYLVKPFADMLSRSFNEE